MKKITFTLTLLLATLMLAQSQPPQALKYKAVAKDEWGVALPTKEVTLRFTILLGSETGGVVYQELHYTTTNKFGLMDVNIGQGNPVFGYFEEIDWGAGSYFMKVELDTKGGLDFRHEGASQLLSVPYALYAGKAKEATLLPVVDYNDIVNKPDFTFWDQNVLDDFDWDYNSLLNLPDLSNYVERVETQLWDKDVTDDFSGSWNDLLNVPAGFADGIDNDTQLSEAEVDAFVANNGYITGIVWADIPDVPADLADGDDNTQLTEAEVDAYVSNNGYITAILWEDIQNIPEGFADGIDDNTQLSEAQVDAMVANNGYLTQETQDLSIEGHLLTITGGSTVQLPDSVNDADHDPDNELQNLSYVGTQLTISEGNTVDLTPLIDDDDADPVNELQVLSISHDTIFLSEGGFVKLPVTPGQYYYADRDSDGYGDAFSTVFVPAGVAPPAGFLLDLNDCNDQEISVFPGAVEICGDGIDQDCDGLDSVCPPEDIDDDNDGFTENQGDCDDQDVYVYPGAPEICDEKDNDCDGYVDNDCITECLPGHVDCDGDPQNGCEVDPSIDPNNCGECGVVCPEGWVCVDGTCVDANQDNDGDGFYTPEDCNDANATVFPGAPELCDGLDNDCDGTIDEECPPPDCRQNLINLLNCWQANCPEGDLSCLQTYCPDYLTGAFNSSCLNLTCVTDFFNDPEKMATIDPSWTTEQLADYIISVCGSQDEDGDGFSPYDGDCDDNDETIHPGADEVCGDGIDQDCNGSDAVCGDDDGDGYNEDMGDCDDTNPDVYPGAEELCDGLDNDCDGQIDEDAGQEWYPDNDADGWGDESATPLIACEQPPGYVSVEFMGDCDDSDAAVNPGTQEICDDGTDQNCDGVDEICADIDGDGIPDSQDNCPNTYNPDQADSDADGIGDACREGQALLLTQIYPTTVYNGINTQVGLWFEHMDQELTNVVLVSADQLATQVEFFVLSPTEVVIIVPAGLAPGDYSIEYSWSNGTGIFSNGIMIVENLTLNINAVTPEVLPESVSSEILIQTDPGLTDPTTVYLSADAVNDLTSIPLANIFIDNTTLRATVPEGVPVGSYSVVVVTLDGNVGLYSPVFIAFDDDADGIPNDTDNCPNTYNPDQADSDANGIGDACEAGSTVHLVGIEPFEVTLSTNSSFEFTLLLDGPAPVGGAIVDIITSSPELIVPAQVIIPEGQATASFPVTTGQIAELVMIDCFYEGDVVSATVFVEEVVITDNDGDGYTSDVDCDDNDPNKFPGQMWYPDCDGDGFYNSTGVAACDEVEASAIFDCNGNGEPVGGFTNTPGNDCNDDDPAINPLAPETCDGVDNDCDGQTDSDDPDNQGQVWYLDADGDGFGDFSQTIISCEPLPGYALNGDDCDDSNVSVYPGALEIPDDGIDQDCDGIDDSALASYEVTSILPYYHYMGMPGGFQVTTEGITGDGDVQILSFEIVRDDLAFTYPLPHQEITNSLYELFLSGIEEIGVYTLIIHTNDGLSRQIPNSIFIMSPASENPSSVIPEVVDNNSNQLISISYFNAYTGQPAVYLKNQLDQSAVQINNVTYPSPTTIQAEIPAGFTPGDYDIIVMTSGGVFETFQILE